MPVDQKNLALTDEDQSSQKYNSNTTKTKKKEASSKERHSRQRNDSATHYTLQTRRPLSSTIVVTPSITASATTPSTSLTILSSTTTASESPVATAAVSVSAAETSSVPSADTNSSKDSLMGSMIGALAGISILLLIIILLASKNRRKWKSEQGEPKRGWGVRNSWYSTTDTVSSRCPSTLPPPYDEGILKKQEYLEPPSPIVTKSTQYSPQLAYSPSFSVDHSHLITGNQAPAGAMPTLGDQRPPPPVPRPSRSTVRTYQAQLNHSIGPSPDQTN